MQTLLNRIKMIIVMMAKGGGKSIGREIVRRFYSNEISYCLRRDLTAHFECSAKTGVNIEEIFIKLADLILKKENL